MKVDAEELYWTIIEELQDEKTADFVHFTKELVEPFGGNSLVVLEETLKDGRVSMGVKNYLAAVAIHQRSAQLWGLKHFNGNALSELVQWLTLSEYMVKTLLANPNLEWESVKATINGRALGSPPAFDSAVGAGATKHTPRQASFIQNLPEKLFVKIAPSLLEYEQKWKINDDTTANRICKIYDIDEGVPIEWLVKMLS